MSLIPDSFDRQRIIDIHNMMNTEEIAFFLELIKDRIEVECEVAGFNCSSTLEFDDEYPAVTIHGTDFYLNLAPMSFKDWLFLVGVGSWMQPADLKKRLNLLTKKFGELRKESDEAKKLHDQFWAAVKKQGKDWIASRSTNAITVSTKAKTAESV